MVHLLGAFWHKSDFMKKKEILVRKWRWKRHRAWWYSELVVMKDSSRTSSDVTVVGIWWPVNLITNHRHQSCSPEFLRLYKCFAQKEKKYTIEMKDTKKNIEELPEIDLTPQGFRWCRSYNHLHQRYWSGGGSSKLQCDSKPVHHRSNQVVALGVLSTVDFIKERK